jgi:hypothetical protein
VSDQKRDYVRREMKGAHGGHHCHWPGCGKSCPPACWGCYRHWMMLPKYLRDKVWAAFRPGQEVSKTPSAAYLAVAREVRAWIKENYPDG